MTVAVPVPSAGADKPVTEPFSQPVGEPLVPPAEQEIQMPEPQAVRANTLPPGRTVAEQLEINNQIIDACGMGNAECQAEMGYISVTPPPPTDDERWLEGTIGAAIVVILGGLWFAARVWAWLFASRSAYRYITKRE